jgi:parvulin-like peptidyl-prolyl isomerase
LETLPKIYFRKQFLEMTTLNDNDYLPLFSGLTDLADISVILLEDDERASEVRQTIASGMNFEEAARKHSKGLSAYKGGEQTDLTPGTPDYSAEEKKAIFSSPPGSVLGPFPNPTGLVSLIHVIKVRKVADLQEEIRREKSDELRRRKAMERYLTHLNDVMVRTEIEINEDFFEKKKTDGARKPYLAWVRGKYIYPWDLPVDFTTGQHSHVQYRAILNKRIMNVIAAEEARASGMESSEEYRRKREVFRISLLPNLYLDDRYKESSSPITDGDVQVFYKEYYTPDVYRVWVVLNEDRNAVEKALSAVKEKKPLPRIAAEFSMDQSRMQGGVVGPVSLNTFDPTVRQHLTNLKKGEVTPVIKIAGRYGIVMLLDHEVVPVPGIEDLSTKIKRRIELRRRGSFIEKERKRVQEQMRVTVDKKRLEGLN